MKWNDVIVPRRQPSDRSLVSPLSRRLSLRSTALARRMSSGSNQKTKQQNPTLPWIDALAESTRFWRTLVDVKRQVLHQPSSLERGSAATRTVVRSISLLTPANELTHISRINRR
jgi:hypothetical protein